MVKTRKNKSNHKKSIKFRKKGGTFRGNSNFVNERARFEYARSKRGILIDTIAKLRENERKLEMYKIKRNKEKWYRNFNTIPADEIENKIHQIEGEIEQHKRMYSLSNNNYDPMFATLEDLNDQLTRLKELQKNKIINTTPLRYFFLNINKHN